MYNKILIGQSTPVLDQGYIQLIDYMGTDETIVNAARTSYGNDELHELAALEAAYEVLGIKIVQIAKFEEVTKFISENNNVYEYSNLSSTIRSFSSRKTELLEILKTKDEVLLRLLMRHKHGTPFEMCEVTFRLQIPMDAWRQMVRHRTASINEYSTRYTEAIDAMQCTAPDQWRLQATDNKQGSSGFLSTWDEKFLDDFDESYTAAVSPGLHLSTREAEFHRLARELYEERLMFGIAKEQARKDLPLSTYTRLYWKCDLRNIFHFLGLRMDSHAQLEIRQYANAMAGFIKQLFPVAYKAFEDYQLNAVTFSAMEMNVVKEAIRFANDQLNANELESIPKQPGMTKREWNEFLTKVDLK
jgi:flavin-dependent thymidylate synthase